MREVRVGNEVETVLERSDCPPARIHDILSRETVAVLGYGVQGRGQSLNLRDNGVRVIVGLRESSPGWKLAVADGWKSGETLFSLGDAARLGSVIFYLLSDAGQKEHWPQLKPHLTAGKALVFAHGFSVVYADQTGVVPPADVDVLLVAPKGSGTTLRRNFEAGRFINSGIGVEQDATGRARDRCIALAFAIGSGFLFETSCRKEVVCDLVGERGSLLGAIYGLWLAQYEVLRERGHSPAEAFNETVEEATQSLYPLIAENGMDWMYAHCSTTAQRGALDWFQKFRDAAKPVFAQLYDAVADGSEARRALATNGEPDYRQRLDAELRRIAASEMWTVGRQIRELRSE